MVIDPGNNLNINKNGVSTSHGAKSRGADSAPASAGKTETPTPANSDTVSLSGTAKTLGQLEAQLTEEPAVDNAKVEAIKQALEDGSYQIDSQKIASGMLSQDQMFN